MAGFYRRQTMAVLIEGLESAFGWFGGVPQEFLFDQMRAVVLSDGRAGGGELVLNAEFLRFAAHWGFRPRSCRPYRLWEPAGAKAPVGTARQRQQRLLLVALEALHRALPGGGAPAHVGRSLKPQERLLVQVLVVQELPAVEEAVADVADGPLHLARRPLPVTVDVERRSLSVYAEAVS